MRSCIAAKKGFLPSTITQLFLQHVVDYTRGIERDQRQAVICPLNSDTRLLIALFNRRLEKERRFNHRAIVKLAPRPYTEPIPVI